MGEIFCRTWFGQHLGRKLRCKIYLVFFFCGVPIPLWPGGLAYRAVRLWRRERERGEIQRFSQGTAWWNFLNPRLNAITRVRWGIQIADGGRKWARQGEQRQGKKKHMVRIVHKCTLLWFLTWWLTHVHHHTLMTKPVTSLGALGGPLT